MRTRDPHIDDPLLLLLLLLVLEGRRVTKALIQDFLGKNEMHEFDIVEIEFAICRN